MGSRLFAEGPFTLHSDPAGAVRDVVTRERYPPVIWSVSACASLSVHCGLVEECMSRRGLCNLCLSMAVTVRVLADIEYGLRSLYVTFFSWYALGLLIDPFLASCSCMTMF